MQIPLGWASQIRDSLHPSKTRGRYLVVATLAILVAQASPASGALSATPDCVALDGRVDALAWSPDGTSLAIAVSLEGVARIVLLESAVMSPATVVQAPAGSDPGWDGPFDGGIAMGDDGSLYWSGGTATEPTIMRATPDGAVTAFFDPRAAGDAWWPGSLSWTTDGIEAIRIPDPRHPVGGEGVTIGADGVIATTALAYPDTSVLQVTPEGATRFMVAGPDELGYQVGVTSGEDAFYTILEGPLSAMALAADGSHYLYGGVGGLWSSPIDGTSETREGATSVAHAVAVNVNGVIAYAVPTDTSATMPEDGIVVIPDTAPEGVCFASASWASAQ